MSKEEFGSEDVGWITAYRLEAYERAIEGRMAVLQLFVLAEVEKKKELICITIIK